MKVSLTLLLASGTILVAQTASQPTSQPQLGIQPRSSQPRAMTIQVAPSVAPDIPVPHPGVVPSGQQSQIFVPSSGNIARGSANVNHRSPGVISDVAGAAGLGSSSAATGGIAGTGPTFNQQLRSAVLGGGTHEIFFPESGSTIVVTADSGVVTLSGNVQNAGQRRNLEQRVQNILGVTTVENQLHVSNTGPTARRIESPQEQQKGSRPRDLYTP